MAEGKASCALGKDCSDCGVRELCTVPGAPRLRLPKVTLPSASAPPRPPLRTSEILLMILGSAKFRYKSERSYRTWCRQEPKVSCLFFADDSSKPTDADAITSVDGGGSASRTSGDDAATSAASFGAANGRALGAAGGGATMTTTTMAARAGEDGGMRYVTVSGAAPPRHCCATKRSSSGKRRPNFFCTPHRAKTLTAQYRYLPALRHVQRSSAVQSGAYQWIVLVDDDAFVFVPRLVWILSRLNASAPLYLGDFGSSGEAVALRPSIPHFACGGGGSVLSIAALQAMDLAACQREYHAKCMQSDWMIGGCARRHGVMELRELGCGTCDPRRMRERPYVDGVRQRLRQDRCYFLQQASPLAAELPLARHSGAIVHGLSDVTSAAFFRRHNASANAGGRRRGLASHGPNLQDEVQREYLHEVSRSRRSVAATGT